MSIPQSVMKSRNPGHAGIYQAPKAKQTLQ